MEKAQTKPERASATSPVISLERGKIPPQAVNLEEVVLGAMMIDKKGVDEAIDILHPDAFYSQKHQAIYEAILQLFESGEPIDLLTVANRLRQNKKLEVARSEEHTSELQSRGHLVCRLLLEK